MTTFPPFCNLLYILRCVLETPRIIKIYFDGYTHDGS